jgi:rod shape-determining protein MreC
MRNLLRFLFTYRIFLLFLGLEFIAFSLIYRSESYQRSAMREKAIGIAGEFHQWRSGFNYYFHLRDENEMLKNENARLRKQILNIEKRREAYALPDSAQRNRYSLVPANMIYNTTTARANTILIDRGRLDGVESYVGVINQDGVVGVIRDASDHFAIGLSLLNVKLKVNAKLLRSGYSGVVNWDGVSRNSIQLRDIPYHVDVQKGDTIVTNSYSQLFPPGISIGYVTSAERIPGTNYWEIELEPAVDFAKLGTVYSVRNLFRDEVDTLLNTTP